MTLPHQISVQCNDSIANILFIEYKAPLRDRCISHRVCFLIHKTLLYFLHIFVLVNYSKKAPKDSVI